MAQYTAWLVRGLAERPEVEVFADGGLREPRPGWLPERVGWRAVGRRRLGRGRAGAGRLARPRTCLDAHLALYRFIRDGRDGR